MGYYLAFLDLAGSGFKAIEPFVGYIGMGSLGLMSAWMLFANVGIPEPARPADKTD